MKYYRGHGVTLWILCRKFNGKIHGICGSPSNVILPRFKTSWLVETTFEEYLRNTSNAFYFLFFFKYTSAAFKRRKSKDLRWNYFEEKRKYNPLCVILLVFYFKVCNLIYIKMIFYSIIYILFINNIIL